MHMITIQKAIINRVESSQTVNYSAWTIGLTHSPSERRQQHEADGESTKYWEQWVADSLSDAQKLETYFINTKNMNGGTGGNLDEQKTVYVIYYDLAEEETLICSSSVEDVVDKKSKAGKANSIFFS